MFFMSVGGHVVALSSFWHQPTFCTAARRLACSCFAFLHFTVVLQRWLVGSLFPARWRAGSFLLPGTAVKSSEITQTRHAAADV